MNDFRIIRPLGRGGMAEVFLAERSDGMLAAVKVLLPQFAQDPEIVRRFMLEMKATASLQSPHVVEILDFGEANGQYFLATEYMDGGSVRDLFIRSSGRLPTPTIEAIGGMLLKGLAAAHARHVIHRDVKPANILLSSVGCAKVSDFGVARALDVPGPTRTGLIMGTPAYMSPEQATGEKLDDRSDLFSAGIVLYELTAGFNPFAGTNESASLVKVIAADPPLLSDVTPAIPAHLEAFIHRLLAKDRAHRFASADEALGELAKYARAAVDRPEDAVRNVLADPVVSFAQWATVQGQRHFTYAESLLQIGPARKPQAILELFRAHLLAPMLTGAEARLTELFAGRDPFAPPQNPKIVELEAELSKQPGSHALLMQLAALYKLELAPLKAIACYKRALRQRPDDGYAAGQLRSLVGDEADSFLPSTHLTLQTQPPRPSTSPASQGSAPVITRPRSGAVSRVVPVQPSSPPAIGYVAEAKNPLAGRLIWLGVALTGVAVLVGTIRAVGRFVAAGQSSTVKEGARLGQALTHQDGPSTQEAIHQRVAAFREQGNAAFEKAMQLAHEGATDQAEQALRDFRTSYPKNPNVPEATFQLAKVYLGDHQPAAALDELQPFVASHPGSAHVPEAGLLIAEAHRMQNDNGEAIKEFDQIVSDHPDSPVVTKAELEAGELYAEKGDAETARKRFLAVESRTGPTDALYLQAAAGLKGLGSKAP